MSKTLKRSILFLVIALLVLFLGGNAVHAIVYEDLYWYSTNSVVEKGQTYDERFVDHIEGLTYQLASDSDDLPNGLSLTDDGRIAGTVSETQEYESYSVEIDVYDGETNLGYYVIYFKIIDDLEELEWVNFNNLFMDTTTINVGSREYYSEDGFVVYDPTLSNYISYNAQTKTYNVTLTQDFEEEDIGNYLELVFDETEYEKYVRFDMIENVGFLPCSPYLIRLADYKYTYGDEILYSAYIYAEVDQSYTGANRHFRVKLSNPYDSTQYRYIDFNITDSNELFVAFETNGGSSIPSMQTEIGEAITLPTNPTKEGWVFEGWYTDEELQTAFDVDTELTTNLVLYAKWKNDYKFTEGAEQKYVLGENENAKFKINANFELLDKVFVDDEELDSSKYTKEKGSTIITLLEDYVKTLSVGEHTLKVTYTDDSTVETTFVIANQEKDNTPKTGIENNLSVACLLVVISLLGIIYLERK